MRLGSSRPLAPHEFERLREDLAARLDARRRSRLAPGQASPIPDEIGLQLTNRCNLRCKECFQWNDDGHHRRLPVIDRDRDLAFEIDRFLGGEEHAAQGRTRCTATAARLSVLPDGRLTSCKLFPEFSYARLDGDPATVLAAWQGAEAARLRTELSGDLMPICGKCVQLYLHGY